MNISSETQPPYYRLGVGNFRFHQRRSKVLGVVNTLLTILLVLVGLLLLFSLVPKNERLCIWPKPGSRCFWPFDRPNTVVLISMDGFRHDYLEIVRARLGPNSLPNFARLEAQGVRAQRSINTFPTVTMPNHHTLVTGLYPQDHGVISNDLMDEHWPNVTFSMGDQVSLNEAPWLVNWPEPIWVTLQKSGGLAGSLLWPLTDGSVANDLPFQQVSEFTLLDGSPAQYPYRKRVTDLLWWLDNPHFRLDLILAYFDEPDETGHAYGPESEQVANKVVELDEILGRLLDGLESRGLLHKVDIILTADHGMTSTSKSKLIALDDYVDPSFYHDVQLSSIGLLYPVPGKANEIYDKLNNVHPNLKVFWRSEVPQDLHFDRNHSRMPAIVLVPDVNWYVVHKQTDTLPHGVHGYLPSLTDMNPFLIASGPSFRRNATVESTHAVDIYPLMSRLLRIRPNPNNGSLTRIAKALLNPKAAARVLALETWPHWLMLMVFELELLWFLSVFSLLMMILGGLVISLQLQRRYSRLALLAEDDYDGKHVVVL